MKQRKVKRVVKFFGLALSAMLFANAPTMEVTAAQTHGETTEAVENLETEIIDVTDEGQMQNPNARTFLVGCEILVSGSSDGMRVSFLTDSVGQASSIGVKDIVIKKKVWYGWKTVATAAGAEFQNTSSFGCSVLYTDAEYGETYRISCVHYGTVDVYTEVENQLDSVVFTY